MTIVDLAAEIQIPMRTIQKIPWCIRDQYLRIFTEVLVAVEMSYGPGGTDGPSPTTAWTLFILLPRLLLHHTARGGQASERELKQRIGLFDTGRWDQLLTSARSSATRPRTSKRTRDPESQKLDQALRLAKMGELSHAARVLSSSGLAAGTDATLRELRDPQLRPAEPAEPFPDGLHAFQPAGMLTLDRQLFGDVLRQTRRGLSAGLWGARYEHYNICLENDTAFEALGNVAERLARAQVPVAIRDALHVSSLTALTKPNNRVRGISAGDTFRRLVAKTLARQFGAQLQAAVWPMNFGLCNAGGTDAAINFLRYVSEENPQKIIMSIDGVGAFDHVSRT